MTGERWYWCFAHGRAEREPTDCRADRRLGPYPTRENAEHWRERAEERNRRWDAEDRRWKGQAD